MFNIGVAKGNLRPGDKNYSCVPVNKTTEFKVKNRCKSAEEVKAEHSSYFVLFQ